jgi:hypothetical protein
MQKDQIPWFRQEAETFLNSDHFHGDVWVLDLQQLSCCELKASSTG